MRHGEASSSSASNSFNNNNNNDNDNPKRINKTKGNAVVITDGCYSWWQQFETYLLQRMTAKTAGDRLRYAKQFHSVLTNGDAQSLLQLKPDKRIHAMKAIASLARFSGSYDVWMQIRERYNLKWSTGNEALTTFERFFDYSRTLDTMLSWVREAIRVLPAPMGGVIKFNCMTGLRPNETIQAIRLIKDPEHFKTHYNEDRQCLEHFRFPEIFLRRTKSAYISIVDNQLLGIAQNIGKTPPTKP